MMPPLCDKPAFLPKAEFIEGKTNFHTKLIARGMPDLNLCFCAEFSPNRADRRVFGGKNAKFFAVECENSLLWKVKN
jgi:hypothetical protein